MSVWGRIFASVYDTCMAGSERAGLGDRRHALLAGARGDVLEIGAGTGVNLAHYPGSVELVLTEPEAPMAHRLEQKLARSGRSALVVRASSEQLPFDDASFDCVVSTLVLCTVADPSRALSEIHRVLRPGGELRFMEHVRSSDSRLARWQDRLNGPWIRLGHGCNCNRQTLVAIEGAHFSVTALERDQLPKSLPIVRPLIVGTAEAV
jgi:ubiquinone/menaquinone biosynthesis C-methylase UbiE